MNDNEYDLIMKILKERYATKEFDGRDIGEENLRKILEGVRLSPSSYNLQPWKIIVVKEKETKEKLFKHSYNQKQITTCSHLLVFCANTNIEEILKNFEEMSRETYGEKVKQRINYLRDFLSSMSDKELLHYAQLQVYIAASYSLLISKSLGIDSCPMAGFSSEGYSKVLSLDKYTIPTLLVPLGYGLEKNTHKKLRYPLSKIVLEK